MERDRWTSCSERFRIATLRGRGVVKRTIDIALAVFALIALSPIMLVCAMLVRLTSPGPVFFRQKRYGWMVKRSSLEIPIDEDVRQCPVVKQATKNDPRVTPMENSCVEFP